MPHPSPRRDRFPCLLPLIAAYGLGLPSLIAGDSLLQPFVPRLPGESHSGDIGVEVPPFLQPQTTDTPGQDTGSQAVSPAAQSGWIGDTWISNVPSTNRFDGVHLQTDAERDFAAVDRWRRGFTITVLILLVCAAIASCATLVALAYRR
jgi:hypothetical protein